MAPQASSSKSKKRKQSPFDLKMALAAKRLAMLQDDDDDDDHTLVPIELPKQLESRSTSGIMELDGDHLSDSDDPLQKNTVMYSLSRTKPLNDSEDGSLSGSDIVVSYPSATKGKRSCKRRLVLSDDDSEHDEKHDDIRTTKTQRGTTCKRPRKNVSEIHDPSAKPRKRTKTAKESDDSPGEISPVLKRAKEIQENLSAEYPSFIRIMLPSHVSGGFWLGLSGDVCDNFMPLCDSFVSLVDEAGNKFAVKYLLAKTALSGGWKKFAIAHKLCVGDAVIFRKVAPTTFQAYIVRKNSLDEVDGALGLLNLENCAQQPISAEAEDHAHEILEAKASPPRDSASPSSSGFDLGSEVLNGITLSDSGASFGAVQGMENFSIIVKGLVLDSKLPDAYRKKYYELCCRGKSFLHEHLLKGLNCSLVVGIILETINIADAIQAYTSATSDEDLKTWVKILKGFEVLGMKVDFLLTRLHQLLDSAVEFNKAVESKRFGKYIQEKTCANERFKALEKQLNELRQVMEKINNEMEAEMTESARKHEARIMEIANSPW